MPLGPLSAPGGVTPGAQPPSFSTEIQWMSDDRGHETPQRGLPPVDTELVQSWQVSDLLVLLRAPIVLRAREHVVVVDDGAVGVVIGDAELVRKVVEDGGVRTLRSLFSRAALFMAKTRPNRSYQGPSPTRSMALTAVPPGPAVTLKNARHVLPLPGIPISATWRQISSAPSSPLVLPKRRSPPKPS